MSRSQGASAVYSGKTFREIIATVGNATLDVAPITPCSIDGEDQYGRKMKAAMYFPVATPVFPDGFYVECQHQNKTGSAEDKIDSKCRTISEFYDRPTLLVIDGGESHRMAKAARQYVGNGSLYEVMSLYGFWHYCLTAKDTLDPFQPQLFK